MSQMIEELWRDDPITISDVAVTLGEMAESFDGGEYAISDETRRALIDFAHGIPDHPLFAVVGHYFAQNPVPGATQPAARRVTDGPLARPLKAEWTPDCGGKQDFDADLIALSTRYWPRGGGYLVVNGGVVYDNDSRPEVRPSAKASILAQGDKIASAYFEADSEAEVKAQVEQWATQQWDRIRSALAESFAQPAEGVSGG